MLLYGGVELLFPDQDGELAKWLREHHDIADAVLFGDSLSQLSPRRGLLPWLGDRKGVGQTIANYAPPPLPRLNTLYWPTGATRWARGFFLATGEAKRKILQRSHDGNTALPLKMGEDGSYIETKLFLLPPRPLSGIVPGKPDETLWLIPLVDERYWWQFRSTEDLEISEGESEEEGVISSWDDLFDEIGSAIGVTVEIPTAIPASYKSPDHVEFTRRYENAAMMLDAAALSVGKRIVRRLDGTVRAESFDDADTVVEENDELSYSVVAGGDIDAVALPAKVLVTFPKWRHYRLLQRGQVYKVEKTPDDAETVASTFKLIRSTFHADYSSDTSPPANTSDLDALAQVIADDFYGWFGRQFDKTFAGVHQWQPTGFDDCAVWEFGRQVDGKYRAHTRVQSMPNDFGFDLQLSQDPEKWLIESPKLGKIDASISKNARGTVSVWDGRSGEKSDSGINVEACASSAALSNTSKFVALNWVDDDWEVACWEV